MVGLRHLGLVTLLLTVVGCSESGHGNGIPWTKDGYRVKYDENGKEIITNEKMWD